MVNNDFIIRTYGRTELALLYSPNLTSQAAWRKLQSWIELNTELSNELYLLGYDGDKMRSFTPKMVSRIVYHLGVP